MMPTIYTLSLDKIKSAAGKFRLRPNSVVSLGQFTGVRSVYGPVSSLWTAEISTAQMERADWQYLSAFFSRGRGVAGLVRMTDPWRRYPLRDQMLLDANGLGTTFFADDTAFVDGTGFISGLLSPLASVYENESAGANSLVMAGLPISLTPVFYAGDIFEIRPAGIASTHGNLYEISNNANTDVNGRVMVDFEPELYSGIAAGDQIVLREPTTVFRPNSDDEGVVERYLADLGATGFSLVEERP